MESNQFCWIFIVRLYKKKQNKDLKRLKFDYNDTTF